ncbi:metallophosphoesterase [Paenibacillus sp. GCM10027627]|uniref:metallophosphoesterase n=1 Tax=unclassified Paenibacillus TaxID=185978 RepID=UPI00362F46B2
MDIALLVMAIGAIGALIYAAFIFPTQWLKVEHVRYSAGIGARILQISDLHVEMNRISARRLQAEINRIRPDYIFLTGDFTSRPRHLPKLEHYLSPIAASGVPLFAVLGNHDHKFSRPSLGRMIAMMNRLGIVVLRNESVSLPGFDLVGIDNYSTGHSRIGKAFRDVTGAKPILVITHDPNLVLDLRRPFTYLMAGHLHGKQLNIPYFYALRPKGPLPASGVYKGFHQSANGAFYISKGIGQVGLNARFMVRSEITVHEL